MNWGYRDRAYRPPERAIARIDMGWKLMSVERPVCLRVTRRFGDIEVRAHLDWIPKRRMWTWAAWPLRPELADVVRETGESDDFVYALKGAERAACKVRAAVERFDQGSLVPS